MPRANKPPETRRVFIGIPVDDRAQARIEKLLNPVRKAGLDVRWVPARNRHLTLAFLGNRSKSEVDILISSFDQAYQLKSEFSYAFPRLARFPNSSGRIIALIADPGPQMSELFSATLGLLKRCNIRFDGKSLRPHVTLGRIKKARQEKLRIDQHTNISLNIQMLTLYQSTLTDSGSIYSPLKETRLLTGQTAR